MPGSLDVTDLVNVDLAFEQIRVGFVADGDEHTGAGKGLLCAGLQIPQAHSRDAILVGAQHLFDRRCSR